MSAEWDTFVDEFLEGIFTANPTFAVHLGRHEFDGRLPDWSEEGLSDEVGRLESARSRALEFDPVDLTGPRRFERDYLISVIDGELFWLETAESPWRNPTFYTHALDPNIYLTRPYAPLTERMRAFIGWARAVPEAASQIRENLRTPMPRTYLEVARLAFGGLVAFLEDDVPAIFGAADDPSLRAQFDDATAGASRALAELDAWFEEQLDSATGTDGFALGADTFSRMLWMTERVDVSLDRLEEAGRADLERNLEALREACEDYAPGCRPRDCVARVRAHKPEPDTVRAAADQIEKLERFVRDSGLVTIPGPEVAQVREAPPHQRWNAAYIDIAGPYETGVPSIYYIAPPDPEWTPEEQAAYIPGVADLLFVTIHEIWPGHFLQFLHSHRSSSKIGRALVGYGFAEGWAHYAEELMWEAGLGDGDPEVRIGLLLNSLLRNVRYLSSLGLHTGRMTVEESERMFRESGYQDPGSARQQAARGTFDPAYLNYTLGKLMMRRLRDEWVAGRGGRSAWREFHDAVLSYGGPPIPLVREEMLGPGAGPPL